MLASNLAGIQPVAGIQPRRHPTNLLSFVAMKPHISRTPCHGAWTPAPLSAHPPIECRCTAPQIEPPFVSAAQQLISFSDNNNIRAAQWVDTGTHPPGWPSQEKPGSSLTASAPVSGVSAPTCTNGVWHPLLPVSVAQKNKQSTMLSANVQSIDLPMDCKAWRFWTTRQLNGCSTPAPKSSAAKQWIEELAQKKKKRYATSCCFLCVWLRDFRINSRKNSL